MEFERPELASVVIPQRGHVDLTVACVEGLRVHEGRGVEIVVVDDGTEGDWRATQTTLEGLGVRVVAQAAAGVTAAWNRGWKESRGGIVVFLNNDVRIEGAFVDRLRVPLAERAAHVAGVEWRWEGTAPGGAIPGWMCLAGYCFAVRRDWLSERGGFDERMRVYWSDTDAQWEARQAGEAAALVRVETAGAVRHLGHRTAREMPGRRGVWRGDREAFLGKWG
jgi:GT2 family glycosyltransferase